MKSGHRSKLRNKAIGACSLFAVILSLLIGGLGYYQYRINIEESYQNYARTLVSIASSKIDKEGLQQAIETGVLNNAYNTLQQELNDIKENSDTQYIYVIYYPEGVEEGTLAYVMNGYTQNEEKYESDTISYLGDETDETDFGQEFRARLKESLLENDSYVRFMDNRTQVAGGQGSIEYVKTAYMPVRDVGGSLVCVLCADISMTRIYNNLHSYLITVVVGASLVVAVFLAIFLMVMNRQVIRPIKMIAERADDFVKQSYAVSDPSQFHFQEITTKTRDEIQSLAESLNHTMMELIRYMMDMKSMSAAQERICAELNVAKQIQLNLYPCTFPAFPERAEFDIYASLESNQGAGGDFYNFFFTDNTHLCVMIGSVSGTGIPTTMFAAITTTVMKSFAQLGYPAARVMAETNNQISNNNRAELSADTFIGIIDLISGRMEYVTAGDIKPLLKKSGGMFEPLVNKKGIRLGAMENVPYFQQSIYLVQGDMLFLYTPAVAETMDDRGNVYSDVYVMERINGITGQEVLLDRMIGAMSGDIRRFSVSKKQERDRTMLLVRYYG